MTAWVENSLGRADLKSRRVHFRVSGKGARPLPRHRRADILRECRRGEHPAAATPGGRRTMTIATADATSEKSYLDGQFLVAMPGLADERFARSIIYMCAHSADGAMGIVLNQPAARVAFPDLLVQLDVVEAEGRDNLPTLARDMKVRHGGPVETGRGFVLHSSDYYLQNATLPIDDDVSLTTTLEVLKAIAEGRGPKRALLALGYAGWAPGQLESEIQYNGWLNCPADADILFGDDLDGMYARVMRKLGIDPGMLSAQAGHA
jgi:putative transcriptional regulator